MSLTAAERAKRYRARRRDGVVTVRDVPALKRDELDDRLGRIEGLLEELVAALIHTVDKRDVTARHDVRRDVTERHEIEGAPAPARVYPRPGALRAPRAASLNHRDVTELLDRVADGTIEAQAERILEVLGRAHTPQSAAAIADELDIPGVNVVAALVTLHGAGRVARFAGETALERDRWAPVVVSSPGETIRCSAYREHALVGHRRDPATGGFRCYVCEPDVGQLQASL